MGQRPKIQSFDPRWMIEEVKKHIDAVISGESPCNAEAGSLSSYVAIRALIEHLEKYGVQITDNSGWDCPTAPDGMCHYSKDFDHCDYCGQPEERK